ncbi:MAG: hypothetical protein RIQ93_1006 [Verrucomicrobiota bacterium]|jgi:hypothetical protein
MLRPPNFLALALLAALAPAGMPAEAERTAYARVDIAPSTTSIYIGTVSLTLEPLVRQESTYEARYVAKVFPYFFSNEAGRLRVELSNEQLRTLARGESVEFKGHGVRDDGTERRVAGKAIPNDSHSGRLKVRVFVSPETELIFNTTYRFSEKPET